MKPFKLNPVLNYRKMLERVECQKLAALHMEKRRREDVIAATRAALEDCCLSLEKRRDEGMPVYELVMMESHVQHYQDRLGVLMKDFQQFEKDIENQQQVLNEAGQKKKLMEKLKERFVEKETELLQQKERAEIDEIAVLFHKR